MFKDLFSLKGRVALVTGGSRGIGKMIAAGFLAQGAAKVYITARKAGPCEATAKELSAQYDGECIALPIDISTVEGCDKLAAEIIKLEPKLDILVNNAGAAWGAEFDEFPESGWDKVMDLNVKSLFFLTKALAKPLRAAASPRTARQGHQHRLRRRHLRQSRRDLFLRREQGRRDPPDAAHGDQADQGQHQRHRDRAGRVQVGHEPRRARPFGRRGAKRIPARRIGTDEDMAGVAIYLASRAGDYVVGNTIAVDGGVVYANAGLEIAG